jgi:hypothetical protein
VSLGHLDNSLPAIPDLDMYLVFIVYRIFMFHTMLRNQSLNDMKDRFFIEIRLIWFIVYVQSYKFMRASVGEQQS